MKSIIFQVDIMILDNEVDLQALIIYGRPFISIVRALIDMELVFMTLRINDEQVNFDLCQSI